METVLLRGRGAYGLTAATPPSRQGGCGPRNSPFSRNRQYDESGMGI